MGADALAHISAVVTEYFRRDAIPPIAGMLVEGDVPWDPHDVLADIRDILDDDPAEYVSTELVALSRWIDAGNAHRDPEAVAWGRLAKVAEEAGEVIAACIGATGQNPRKGITCTTGDVIDELLDVAVTALAAIEHLNGHALRLLDNKILRVARRAGLDQ